jgi:hypothetical protein
LDGRKSWYIIELQRTERRAFKEEIKMEGKQRNTEKLRNPEM